MSKPNIIFINSHDTGRYLGTYGKSVETPEIDDLASDGIQFNQFFCSQPQCSPSRGSVMTGMYGHNHGMMGLAHMGHSIHEDCATLPKELNKVGYHTALFGMFHESVNGELDPEKLGYQDYTEVPGNFARDVTDRFVDFLKMYDGEKPFYASVGFEETHRPFDQYEPVDPDTVDIPEYLPDTPEVREDFARFYRSVMDMDEAIGRIKRAVEENGLQENTIIIYTTDHGLAFPRAKGTLYDSGLETAFIIKFPDGMVTQGYQADQMLCNIDILPTILELVGGDVPEGFDGVSFWPLLKGETEEGRESFFAEMTWHDQYHPMRGIRTNDYKYIRNFGDGPKVYMPYDIHSSPSGRVVREDYYVPNVKEELYDLREDPHELHNVAGDGAYAEVLVDLRERVERWMKETDDPILEGPVPGYEADEWKEAEDNPFIK
ncbi:sulfatase family protein [Piscibacillus halophilus]|uniref:Arylsulfatase A n=1 Tax=Piscibacillus halophilus TaxID=571933 RepID=A0A1H9I647_9BACI|nr:sulfatase [Piscibacillus halophilus]SEQ70046.1 Arylsulfatase A [Piscibacillus halophilus]